MLIIKLNRMEEQFKTNALAFVNGNAKYATLIDKINYYIDYNKAVIAARKGHKKPAAETVAST